MPRVFGRGNTKAEANARTGAESYIAGKADIRSVAPATDWRFITYEPEQPAACVNGGEKMHRRGGAKMHQVA